jgi:hypothetical protein
MPIRTNRGRAAVYRRLWGWPLRSPRHLVATLVIVVVLAIGIAIATSHGNAKQAAGGGPAVPGSSTDYFPTDTPTGTGTGAGEGAGGSATGTAGATSAPPLTRLSGPPQTPSSAATSPEAIDVIKTWGQEWVHHPVGMTNAQWLAQLQPYTTQEFLPVMSTVNVANIDATEVTGPPQVKKSYASSVEAMLPTNSGQLDITAISTPQGWQVASYTEAS